MIRLLEHLAFVFDQRSIHPLAITMNVIRAYSNVNGYDATGIKKLIIPVQKPKMASEKLLGIAGREFANEQAMMH